MAGPEASEIQRTVRRILVALDASRESLAALESAAHFAKRLQAELVGLFVEDVNLLRLAQHPFAREVVLSTRAGRSLDAETIVRDLRIQAAMARQALAQAAAQRQLQWSFRVARGAVEAELMAAALEADLVAIGKAIRPLTSRARLGQTARALSQACSRSVLFAVTAEQAGQVTALAYDGTPLAADALDLAARLVSDDGGRLLVFLLAGSTEEAAEHEAAVRRRLRGTGIELEFRRVYGGPAEMLHWIEHIRPRLLVMGAAPNDEALASVVERASCQVLLVRPRE